MQTRIVPPAPHPGRSVVQPLKAETVARLATLLIIAGAAWIGLLPMWAMPEVAPLPVGYSFLPTLIALFPEQQLGCDLDEYLHLRLSPVGTELRLTVEGAGPVSLTLQDGSTGLPAIPGLAVTPRPSEMMPMPGPDLLDPTVVRKSFVLAARVPDR